MPTHWARLYLLFLASSAHAQGDPFSQDPPGLEPRVFAPGVVSLEERWGSVGAGMGAPFK